ncbi:MAG: O-antigen ligase family protein, partial [Gammaproteobacteria bacterium]|nr:O-antigen ligase family protein [Gammaproteobacteria bacterium]
MTALYSKINEHSLFSFLYIAALFSALFYTGNNVYLFSTAFTFISLTLTLVLKQRYSDSQPVFLNGIFISSLLLLGWFAIAVFPSQVKYLTLYNFFWVGSLIIIFLLFSFANKKNDIWHLVWPVTLFLVLFWALYGLIQYYYLHVPTNATFLNRNTLAALINLLLIPAVAYFLIDKAIKPWSWFNTKLASFFLLILFLTVFIISSRGATLSLLTGLSVLIFFIRNLIIKKQLYILLAIIIVAFVTASLSQHFIAGSPEGIAERMITLQNTSAAGNSRFIIWESLLPLFKTMPWYGIGLGSLWLYWPPYRPFNDNSAGFFAHNDYMQITLEAGYPGIILLLLLFIFILTYFIRATKTYQPENKPGAIHHVEIIALFSALTSFASHSIFTYNFYVLP